MGKQKTLVTTIQGAGSVSHRYWHFLPFVWYKSPRGWQKSKKATHAIGIAYIFMVIQVIPAKHEAFSRIRTLCLGITCMVIPR